MVTKEEIYWALKNVYDPEIRVNIVDLGLIYDVEAVEKNITIIMTLTSPNCPVVPQLKQDILDAVRALDSDSHIDLQIVFDPPWDMSMISEEARLELGLEIEI